MCRWVEGVVIVGAGADAGATKSVLGDAGAAGDSERGSMADGRARVPEVLGFIYIYLIEGGLYSKTAMREAKSKNTVYSRHQGLSKQAT